jgi:hypothetical protein
MRDFYHRNKEANKPVPHILGLTATAAQSIAKLLALESLMDSCCKSPHVQKEELQSHMNRPEVERIMFAENVPPLKLSAGLPLLHRLRDGLSISDDPEFQRLQVTDTPGSRHRVQAVLKGNTTFVPSQLKTLCRTAERTQRELGSWAADEFLRIVMQNYIRSTTARATEITPWEYLEKRYLADLLSTLTLPARTAPDFGTALSEKAHTIIRVLLRCPPTTIGVLFARERATVHLLYRLLSLHPGVRKLFRMGAVVGQSSNPKRKGDVTEYVDLGNQSDSLGLFRSGEINLLVATSVLEEGIDVPQCNLVICFDEPARLISYIQRRGRARMRGSRYVILCDEEATTDRKDWDTLEHMMKAECEAVDRELKALPELEVLDHSRQFRATGTDALLDLDNAKAHLGHFCAHLRSRAQSGLMPEYIIQECETLPSEPPHFRAKVILPACVSMGLRVAHSKEAWLTEKYATKDAAFEACVALYKAGLLDDHFLPLHFQDDLDDMDIMASIIDIRARYSPWPEVARAWGAGDELYQQSLTLTDSNGTQMCDVKIITTLCCLPPENFTIYWDATTLYTTTIRRLTRLDSSKVDQTETRAMLQAAHGHLWETDKARHVVEFVDMRISRPSLNQQPTRQVDEDDSNYLVRDVQDRDRPYYLDTTTRQSKAILPDVPIQNILEDGTSGEGVIVTLRPWPRCSDLLHQPPHPKPPKAKQSLVVRPWARMKRDKLQAAYSEFGLLIPFIVHKVETQLVLAKLKRTLLAEVNIAESNSLLAAICTPSAREKNNCRKLAFFGDSVLKFIASVFLAAKCTFSPTHSYCWPLGRPTVTLHSNSDMRNGTQVRTSMCIRNS